MARKKKRKSSGFISPQARAGRQGGLIGGKKRAGVLSRKRRVEIAKQGAGARWSGRR